MRLILAPLPHARRTAMTARRRGRHASAQLPFMPHYPDNRGGFSNQGPPRNRLGRPPRYLRSAITAIPIHANVSVASLGSTPVGCCPPSNGDVSGVLTSTGQASNSARRTRSFSLAVGDALREMTPDLGRRGRIMRGPKSSLPGGSCSEQLNDQFGALALPVNSPRPNNHTFCLIQCPRFAPGIATTRPKCNFVFGRSVHFANAAADCSPRFPSAGPPASNPHWAEFGCWGRAITSSG